MKKNLHPLTIAAAAAALIMMAGCGQSGGDAAVDDSPEGQAYVFRHSVMELLGAKVGTMRAMANGDVPLDEAVFTKAAADTVTLAGMLTEGFEQEGIVAMSRATADIWANWADFESKAGDVVDAATDVASAAEGGDIAGAQELLQPLGQTCGACHRPYRGE